MYDCSHEQAQEAPSHEGALRALQRNALKPPPRDDLDQLLVWSWDWLCVRSLGLPVYEEQRSN